LLFICSILPLIIGCGKQPSPAPPPPSEIKKPKQLEDETLPEVIGIEKKDAEIDEAIQVGKEVEERKIYMVDTRLKTGSVRCKAVIRSPEPLVISKPTAIDLTGKWAIKNPIKFEESVTISVQAIPKRVFTKINGEEDYYRLNTKEPSPWLYVGAYDRVNKWHHVEDAVIILHDLWNGTKPPLQRGSVASQTNGGGNRTGIVNLASYHGRGNSRNIQLTQVNQKVIVYNCDLFPEEFIFLNPEGQESKSQAVGRYEHHIKNPSYLNVMPHVAQHMPHGPYVTSPVYRDAGVHTITSGRCPWKICYALVLNNPYAEASRDGRFQIDGIPIGKFRLEVWHQSLQPKQRFFEVEIKEPEDMLKILIEFIAPDDPVQG
ncbi:MAG: hypothetical protein QF886_24345, partial [Planctomycetota bacterium]|nr:hypothetical protein [Planctomycetota bacterium]